MTEELLHAARHHAETSDPSVRAVALLRIARVLTKIDEAEAERLLDRGLALFASLPEEEKAAMAAQATALSACVAPDRAFALRSTISDPFAADKFLFDMVRHGHAEAAAVYLKQWPDHEQFPYDAALQTMGSLRDDDTRREILRSALRAWRRGEPSWNSIQSFLRLLRYHWRLLPEDEARHEIRHVVRVVATGPNEPLNGSFGGSRGTVRFSSQRTALLFELLGPLKRTDPELARDLIRVDAELARAAELYPDGHDTNSDGPVEPPSAEALEQWHRDWTGFALGMRFFRIDDEMKHDFRDSFDHALRAFARDADRRHPNTAPAECWPSAEDFRTILYNAGRYEGARGARLLERIPHPALRLFAQIELAAGIAGIEQIGGITREQLSGR